MKVKKCGPAYFTFINRFLLKLKVGFKNLKQGLVTIVLFDTERKLNVNKSEYVHDIFLMSSYISLIYVLYLSGLLYQRAIHSQ